MFGTRITALPHSGYSILVQSGDLTGRFRPRAAGRERQDWVRNCHSGPASALPEIAVGVPALAKSLAGRQMLVNRSVWPRGFLADVLHRLPTLPRQHQSHLEFDRCYLGQHGRIPRRSPECQCQFSGSHRSQPGRTRATQAPRLPQSS